MREDCFISAIQRCPKGFNRIIFYQSNLTLQAGQSIIRRVTRSVLQTFSELVCWWPNQRKQVITRENPWAARDDETRRKVVEQKRPGREPKARWCTFALPPLRGSHLSKTELSQHERFTVPREPLLCERVMQAAIPVAPLKLGVLEKHLLDGPFRARPTGPMVVTREVASNPEATLFVTQNSCHTCL